MTLLSSDHTEIKLTFVATLYCVQHKLNPNQQQTFMDLLTPTRGMFGIYVTGVWIKYFTLFEVKSVNGKSVTIQILYPTVKETVVIRKTRSKRIPWIRTNESINNYKSCSHPLFLFYRTEQEAKDEKQRWSREQSENTSLIH